MREEYDFANAKPNPYIKDLRPRVSNSADMIVAESVVAVGTPIAYNSSTESHNGRTNVVERHNITI